MIIVCAYRYRLQFDRESKGEIEARKKAAQEPLEYVAEVCNKIAYLQLTSLTTQTLKAHRSGVWHVLLSMHH